MNTKTLLSGFVSAVFAAGLSAQEVQLNISGGFTTDNWLGYREYQELLTVGGTDLQQAQGGNPVTDGQGRQALDRHNFGLVGAIDGPTAAAHGLGSNDGGGTYYGYALSTSWWRTRTAPAQTPPDYLTDVAGTPLDGVITGGGGRTYHIASHAGNATLPGDWLQETDVSFTGSAGSVTTNMAVKRNAMSIYTAHNNATNTGPATANLPLAQQGNYSDINFVLAAWDTPGGARNARIVAEYSDASEDILYTFADGARIGPAHEDSDPGTFSPAEFSVVETFTFGYNVASGVSGNLTGKSGSLYEFTSPLTVDSSKILTGIRLEDSVPGLAWNERGLSIYGATATSLPVIPESSTTVLVALFALGFFVCRSVRKPFQRR